MFCTKCGSQIADGSKFCNVCGNKMIIPTTEPVGQTPQFGNISPTEPVGQIPQFGNISPTEPVGQTPQFGNISPTEPVGQIPQFSNMTPTEPVGQMPQFGNIAPTSPMGQQFENVTPTMPVEPMVNTSGYQNYSGTKDIPLGNYPISTNSTDKKEEKTSGNKGLIIGLISAVVVLTVVVVVLLFKPSAKKSEKTDSTTSSLNVTTESKTETATATEEITATAATTEQITEEVKDNTDKGGSFMIVNGILSVDNSLFGKTYDELNEYFNYDLPSLTYWEWSEVPLDYLDYFYSDGNKYTLFFENNKLVGVRYETQVYDLKIPGDLYDAAKDRFGDYDMYWYYEDTNQDCEYDWNVKINTKTGMYAIFLNSYDDNYYVAQQYTSGDYSGEYIQNHD